MSSEKKTLLEGAGDPVTDADSGWVPVSELRSGSVTIEIEGLGAGDGVTVYGTNKPDPTDSDAGQAIGSEITDDGDLVGVDPHPEYVRVQGTTDGGNSSTLNAWLRGWQPGT